MRRFYCTDFFFHFVDNKIDFSGLFIFFVLTFRFSVFHILQPCWQFGFLNQIYRFPMYENFFPTHLFRFWHFLSYFINFWEFKKVVFFMLIRHQAKRANWNFTVFAQETADFISMYLIFRINQSQDSLMKRHYSMVVIFIKYMFSYTWLAEVEMTKVTVALYYIGLTKVTSGDILGTVFRIHSRIYSFTKYQNSTKRLFNKKQL